MVFLKLTMRQQQLPKLLSAPHSPKCWVRMPLTGGIIATPLLMTGEGQTKISGSVSKVDIDLKRIVARFDIDNTASKSNLTIQKLTLAQRL